MTAAVRERHRCCALWVCLAIFMVRVVGQIEVLLLAPHWLPPFSAWESGLVPYPVLLPLQIVLIGWMAAVASDHGRGRGPMWVSTIRTRRRLTAFAAGYAGLMLLRLIVTAALAPHAVIDRGLIPIVAHWDLAGFVALLARTPLASAASSVAAAGRSDKSS